MVSTAPHPSLDDARCLLRRVWGYADFRYHQRRAVVAMLQGRDCLAVLPTGGGKSLCFQVPALLGPGLAVVVSPLISLMQDQVNALRSRGVTAAYLSSTQRIEVRNAVWHLVSTGRLKLLYVAPERLPQLVARRVRPTLLAVDEAHCISEWGHEFRPHFRALGRYRGLLGQPPTLALTATATPTTRADICRVLGLRRTVTVLQSFDRPNLFLEALLASTEHDRIRVLATLLRSCRGTAIIYTPTRNRADGLATILRQSGIAAAPYHAGLPGAARRGLLARFLDGRVRVMVATSAFGMGIDKPDVRLVAHAGVPARPEAYYQEAGRAGRDGKPSRCVVVWTARDFDLARRIAGVRRSGRRATGAASDLALAAGLEAMRAFLMTRGCRRRVLLEYLGEAPGGCAGCDRCAGRAR